MLNETQKKMVVEAIGDGSDWPRMTEDPRVNNAVDVEVCGIRPWEELCDKTRKAYTEEAESFSLGHF